MLEISFNVSIDVVLRRILLIITRPLINSKRLPLSLHHTQIQKRDVWSSYHPPHQSRHLIHPCTCGGVSYPCHQTVS